MQLIFHFLCYLASGQYVKSASWNGCSGLLPQVEFCDENVIGEEFTEN